MLYIFNRQKIYSYLVAASMVVILLVVSIFFTSNNIKVVETDYDSEENTVRNV